MTRPALQAEEELIKAQKVFEEMNVDLQEELPSLWNRWARSKGPRPLPGCSCVPGVCPPDPGPLRVCIPG